MSAERVARLAMEFSCARQRPDGSWWYAEAPKYHWIDNFHTGYNLDSLKYYMDASGDGSFLEHLDRGIRFFKEHFIEKDGRPRYYHTRAYPVDIQCAAQAIDTLTLMAERDPSSVWGLLRKSPAGRFGTCSTEMASFSIGSIPW